VKAEVLPLQGNRRDDDVNSRSGEAGCKLLYFVYFTLLTYFIISRVAHERKQLV